MVFTAAMDIRRSMIDMTAMPFGFAAMQIRKIGQECVDFNNIRDRFTGVNVTEAYTFGPGHSYVGSFGPFQTKGRGDWGPLGHFLDFVKYLDSDKQDACITYHN